jgi:hypothetical protein
MSKIFNLKHTFPPRLVVVRILLSPPITTAWLRVKVKKPTMSRPRSIKTTVAEFMDPDWGDKVNSGIGLSYWQANTTTLCRSQLYPPVRDLWIRFGLSQKPHSVWTDRRSRTEASALTEVSSGLGWALVQAARACWCLRSQAWQSCTATMRLCPWPHSVAEVTADWAEVMDR